MAGGQQRSQVGAAAEIADCLQCLQASPRPACAGATGAGAWNNRVPQQCCLCQQVFRGHRLPCRVHGVPVQRQTQQAGTIGCLSSTHPAPSPAYTTNPPQVRLIRASSPVTCLSFSPDGAHIAVGVVSGRFTRVSASPTLPLAPLTLHSGGGKLLWRFGMSKMGGACSSFQAIAMGSLQWRSLRRANT